MNSMRKDVVHFGIVVLLLLPTTTHAWVFPYFPIQLNHRFSRRQRPFVQPSLAASNGDKAATTTATTSTAYRLEGYPKDFERQCQVHETLESLQQQIPLLLQQALTDSSASQVYSPNVKLLVEADDQSAEDEIVLANSREEIISLSNALVFATTTGSTAANTLLLSNNPVLSPFFDNTINNNGSSNNNPPEIHYKMAIDPSLTALRVQWETTTTLPSNRIVGFSEMALDPQTGLITELRLLRVQWNDQLVDAQWIGRRLATLRQIVQNLQNNLPLLKTFQPPAAAAALIRSTVVSSNNGPQSQSPPPPLSSNLYVTSNLSMAFLHEFNVTTTSTLIPVDEYYTNETGKQQKMKTPFPGSKAWNSHAKVLQSLQSFVDQTIPLLSLPDDQSQLLQLFDPSVQLIATDGTILLKGPSKVRSFYQTLAFWRQQSMTDWTVQKIVLAKSKGDMVAMDLTYVSTLRTPQSTTTRITGKDRFVVQMVSSTSRSEDKNAIIQRIQQRDFSVNQRDGLLIMKSFTRALENNGLFNTAAKPTTNNGVDTVIMDFFQRLVNTLGAEDDTKSQSIAAFRQQQQQQQQQEAPLRLSDMAAAARVYDIMMDIHQVIPRYLRKQSNEGQASFANNNVVPLQEYMAEDIELRGYLGETLLSGISLYNGLVRSILGPFRVAVQTNQIRIDESTEKPMISKVELTNKSNIRWNLHLQCKIFPVGGGLLSPPPSSSSSLGGGGGIPLTLFVASEFVLDDITGQIRRHSLLETRVNGQLTPGDVVSRWILQQRGVALTDNASNSNQNTDAFLGGLIDTISWVRSITRGPP